MSEVSALMADAAPALRTFLNHHELAVDAAAALGLDPGLTLSTQRVTELFAAEAGLALEALWGDSDIVAGVRVLVEEAAAGQQQAATDATEAMREALSAQAADAGRMVAHLAAVEEAWQSAAATLSRVVAAKFTALAQFVADGSTLGAVPVEDIQVLVAAVRERSPLVVKDTPLVSAAFGTVAEAPVREVAQTWLAEVFLPHVRDAERDFHEVCGRAEAAVRSVYGLLCAALQQPRCTGSALPALVGTAPPLRLSLGTPLDLVDPEPLATPSAPETLAAPADPADLAVAGRREASGATLPGGAALEAGAQLPGAAGHGG